MRIAAVVGFKHQVDAFCQQMNAHATAWKFVSFDARSPLLLAPLRLRNVDVLIRLAGPGPHPLLLATAEALRIPVFVVWVGTDVERLRDHTFKVPHARRTRLAHLAIAPWLVDELRQVGVDAQYVPILGVTPSPREIPRETFEVLSYLPEPRRSFYGRSHVYEVARQLPHTLFNVVGAGEADPSAPRNVRFHGWLKSVGPLLDQCSVLLRVPDHDGMSFMVLEALARGRYVLWKQPLQGVIQVTTPDDSLRALRELETRWAARSLDYNKPGVDFIATHYEERRVAHGVERFIQQTVEDASSQRQIAITGFDLFCTDVANLNNRMRTGWNAQVVQFDSKYGTVGSLCDVAKSDVWYTIGMLGTQPTMRLFASLTKKPRVMHWVGTDIEVARRKLDLIRPLRRRSVTHLTEIEWEADELRALGIEANIAPLPPRFLSTDPVPPLPSTFTVLAYLPESRTEYYGKRELEQVIRVFRGRQVKFLIVGGGRVEAPAGADLENLGWLFSLKDTYANSSALLRFTPRDGLSLMVLEALAFGRHVLWSKQFPFVRQVLTIDQIIDAIEGLLTLHERGQLQPQLEAVDYVRRAYSREKCIEKIVSFWELARKGASNGNVQEHD